MISFSLTFQPNQNLCSAQVLVLHNSKADSGPQLGLQY